MNIVLTSVHIEKSPDAIPLAPALLKGSLLKNLYKSNLNITIMESFLNESIELFVNKILLQKPNIVGLSIYLWNRTFYLEIAKKLKEKNKNIIIIAGGPEIRSGYENLLTNNVNYTMQGEGEQLICDLIKSINDNLDPNMIPGINDNKNQFISDLDTIPSPLIEKNISLKNYDGYLWELSRGCPYNCDFCFESRGAQGVRYYSFEKIEKELDIIIQNKTPQVFVLDPTFNKDLNRAKKILKLIKRKNRGTHFHFEIRAELLDKEISRLFTDIGASLQIGIQSSNDSVLQLINRRIDKNLFSNKINILNREGAIFGLDLIYGLPGDSYIGFKNSMEYVLSLQPNHLDIFPLSVLPGTALWDNSKKLKLNFMTETPYTIIDNPTYSKNDMQKSQVLKESCDLIYNRCKSTGWLNQVCKEISTSLTDFIEGFHLWNKKTNIKLDDIGLVKSYIKQKFSPKNYSLIEDIINYHSAYSKANLEEKRTTSISKELLKNSIPSLSSTASFLYFTYPILDAIDNGCYSIDLIKKNYRENKNRSIAWFHSGGEIIFDCYSKKIMNYLSKIDGVKNSNNIDTNIDIDFLLFAQDSGMLEFTR